MCHKNDPKSAVLGSLGCPACDVPTPGPPDHKGTRWAPLLCKSTITVASGLQKWGAMNGYDLKVATLVQKIWWTMEFSWIFSEVPWGREAYWKSQQAIHVRMFEAHYLHACLKWLKHLPLQPLEQFLTKYLKTFFHAIPKCELTFHLEFGHRTSFVPFPQWPWVRWALQTSQLDRAQPAGQRPRHVARLAATFTALQIFWMCKMAPKVPAPVILRSNKLQSSFIEKCAHPINWSELSKT